MKRMMKRTLLSGLVIAALSSPALAQENEWQDDAMDAWIDGKVEATLLFNGNLNSFEIDTKVNMGVVTLSGTVDTQVDRKLAGELAKDIDGVREVNNELSVVREKLDETDDEYTGFVDAKIATVIKTRLLSSREVSGTNIDVNVEGLKVTLSGSVASKEERDLALEIAKNADDVQMVTDKLKVASKPNRS